MKKLLLSLTLLLGLYGFAAAYEAAIRDITVEVYLHRTGNAVIHERWDVTVASGTEWYLNRENLDQITLADKYSVYVDDKKLEDEGAWDIDRSLEQKSGKCGVVRKADGFELCWGVGSYGDHVFDVIYTLDNVIDRYSDYDCFHMQLVSPGLSSNPQHVKVTVEEYGQQIDTTCARLWGFGYVGTTAFEDGKAVFETSSEMGTYDSVIALLRLDKEFFLGGVEREGVFDDHLQTALKGADFGDDEDVPWYYMVIGIIIILPILLIPLVPIILVIAVPFSIRKKKRQILGCKPSEVMWARDIPCGGNLEAAQYILKRLDETGKNSPLAGAMILRMVNLGVINVTGVLDGKRVELNFPKELNTEGLTECEKKLLEILIEAAGKDSTLQDKEFSNWASKNSSRIETWLESCTKAGKETCINNGWTDSKAEKFTEIGQLEARSTLGLKKFLTDYTLIKERASREVILWKDYLVFGALFGVADKVAAELKDINPEQFEKLMSGSHSVSSSITLSSSFANVIYSTHTAATKTSYSGGYSGGSSHSSSHGYGGHSSYHGGGGYHGGGRGGGSR